MPGEPAPKLAIAIAAEAAGENELAARFYQRVSKLDPNHTSACFGFARCLGARGDSAAAAAALAMVPSNHSLFTQSRITLAHVLMSEGRDLTREALDEAARTIESISADNGAVHHLAARLFSAAITVLTKSGGSANPRELLLGKPYTERALRFAAEHEYRQAARFASTAEEKMTLVDLANTVRPVTLV
jgi:serine/threonine-protein kinase PknG